MDNNELDKTLQTEDAEVINEGSQIETPEVVSEDSQTETAKAHKPRVWSKKRILAICLSFLFLMVCILLSYFYYQNEKKTELETIKKVEHLIKHEEIIGLMQIANILEWNFILPDTINRSDNYEFTKDYVKYKDDIISVLTYTNSCRTNSVTEASELIVSIKDKELRKKIENFRDEIIKEMETDEKNLDNMKKSLYMVKELVDYSSNENELYQKLADSKYFDALKKTKDIIDYPKNEKYIAYKQEIISYLDKKYSKEYMKKLYDEMQKKVREEVKKDYNQYNSSWVYKHNELFK